MPATTKAGTLTRATAKTAKKMRFPVFFIRIQLLRHPDPLGDNHRSKETSAVPRWASQPSEERLARRPSAAVWRIRCEHQERLAVSAPNPLPNYYEPRKQDLPIAFREPNISTRTGLGQVTNRTTGCEPSGFPACPLTQSNRTFARFLGCVGDLLKAHGPGRQPTPRIRSRSETTDDAPARSARQPAAIGPLVHIRGCPASAIDQHSGAVTSSREAV